MAVHVELHHTVTLGVVYIITEHGGFALSGAGHTAAQHTGESGTVEDVVTQHHAHIIISDELLADDEGLGQTVGTGLLGVFKPYAKILSVAHQALEPWQVVWCGDNQNLTYAGTQQDRDGIINHRLVEDGNHLLADTLRDGIKAGS